MLLPGTGSDAIAETTSKTSNEFVITLPARGVAIDSADNATAWGPVLYGGRNHM